MNTILTILMITVMTYEMPKLPYTNNALEPVISQQTIDYHYGKHLQTYVNNLNNLVPGTEFEGKDLVTIVATAPDGAIFNNAGQVLNHTLYFLQFAPKPFIPLKAALSPRNQIICSSLFRYLSRGIGPLSGSSL